MSNDYQTPDTDTYSRQFVFPELHVEWNVVGSVALGFHSPLPLLRISCWQVCGCRQGFAILVEARGGLYVIGIVKSGFSFGIIPAPWQGPSGPLVGPWTRALGGLNLTLHSMPCHTVMAAYKDNPSFSKAPSDLMCLRLGSF